jgi:hypothetical protein
MSKSRRQCIRKRKQLWRVSTSEKCQTRTLARLMAGRASNPDVLERSRDGPARHWGHGNENAVGLSVT